MPLLTTDTDGPSFQHCRVQNFPLKPEKGITYFILATHQLKNRFLCLPPADLFLTWALLLSMAQTHQENLMARDTPK